MKKKLFSILMAVVLIFSLGAVFSPATTANAVEDVTLTVDVNAWVKDPVTHELTPLTGCIEPCSDFYINATVVASGGTVTGVTATITVATGASLDSEESADPKSLGDIEACRLQDVWWKLHCDEPGSVLITVDAEGMCGSSITGSDTVTVGQCSPDPCPVVIVDIIEPVEHEITIDPCQTFAVKALIQNTGTCARSIEGVTSTITITGPASLVTGMLNTWPLEDMEPGDIHEVGWTVHCDAAGTVKIDVDADFTTPGPLEIIVPDHLHVYQTPVECFSAYITTPQNLDDVCVDCGTFPVEAVIYNTCDVALEGVNALLEVSGNASIVPPPNPSQFLGDIPAHSTKTVEWVAECTAEGDATFSLTVNGYEEGTGDPITLPDSITLHQKIFLVDITTPETCNTFSTEQTFQVTAHFKNCTGVDLTNVPLDITLDPADGAIIAEDPTVQYRDICQCCECDVTWNLTCDKSTLNMGITVTATVGATPYTDTVTVHQELKAHLVGGLDTYYQCQPDQLMVPMSTFDTCQYFHVVAPVFNTGEAAADDVTVQLLITGDAYIVDGTNPQNIGTIVGGAADKATWLVHCYAEGPVTIEVVSLTGIDENTGVAVLDPDNICIPCPIDVNQIPVDIEIIQPESSTVFEVCNNWTVKAKITNQDANDALSGVYAKLYWDGNAELVTGQPNPVPLTPGSDTLEPGEWAEATWVMHCTDEGDVTFWVGMNSDDPVMCIKSEERTVHQKVPADLTVEILSPGGLDLEFQACGMGIAEWSTDEACTDSYSVKLYAPGPGANFGDYGKLIFPLGMAFADLDDFSFYVEGGATAQDLPLHEIELLGISADVTLPTSSACVNSGMAAWNSAATVPATAGRINIAYQPGDADKKTDDRCSWELFGTHSGADIDASDEAWAVFWYTADGVFDQSSGYYTWAEIKAAFGAVATIKDFRVEMRYPPADATVYVDDIIINGATYEAEPVNTYIATSQDFALTAKITNNGGVPITIDTATVTSASTTAGLPTPALPWTLAVGGSVIASWTLHCDASGTCLINLAVSGTDDLDKLHTATDSVGIEQYAAAHLEVQGISAVPTTVNVSENFTVTANIVNTGEADAWDVSAILSVFPEGSARIITGGYTLPVGTLVGHGQEGTFSVSWELHCKVACDTTITITAEGYDEFGWHIKQILHQDDEGNAWATYDLVSNPGRAIDERNIEPASVTVKQLTPVDLAVSKSVDKSRPLLGEEATFTITVTNNGPDVATGVQVTDSLSAGTLTFVSASKGTYSAGVWTVGQLSVGSSATLTLKTTVGTADPITNEASVTAVDQTDWNSFNDSASVILNPAAVTQRSIGLTEDWNLISMPLIPDDTDIGDIFFDIVGNISTDEGVTTYDAETELFSSNIPPDWDFGILNTVEDGPGYWVVMTAADTLVVNGQEIADPPALPPTYDVYVGWNLIGFKSVTPRTASDYLAAIAGKYTIIYRYVNGVYSAVQASDNMVPGQGYWIAIIDVGTIYP